MVDDVKRIHDEYRRWVLWFYTGRPDNPEPSPKDAFEAGFLAGLQTGVTGQWVPYNFQKHRNPLALPEDTDD